MTIKKTESRLTLEDVLPKKESKAVQRLHYEIVKEALFNPPKPSLEQIKVMTNTTGIKTPTTYSYALLAQLILSLLFLIFTLPPIGFLAFIPLMICLLQIGAYSLSELLKDQKTTKVFDSTLFQ